MEKFTSNVSTFDHMNPIICGKDTAFTMKLNFPETKKSFAIFFQTYHDVLLQGWMGIWCPRSPLLVVQTLYDLFETLKVAEELLDPADGSPVQKSYVQQAEESKNFWKRNTPRLK